MEQQIAKVRAKRDVYVKYRGAPRQQDDEVKFNDPDWDKEWYIVSRDIKRFIEDSSIR